ncbi:hypothetical protein [Nocardia sp. SC052]|uniref:hypothetical protein n=1 Tax=Nocardia sichangensis TaxID=3385975 RepID=UPI0039A3957C
MTNEHGGHADSARPARPAGERSARTGSVFAVGQGVPLVGRTESSGHGNDSGDARRDDYAGALWFTAQSLRATNNQYSLSQQTAVTDRFRLAAEQLASDKIDVRLSGVYLLARLGPRHHHGSHSGCGMTAATTYATQA